MGSIEAKTIEINSSMINADRLNVPFSKDSIIHIIKNRGMHIIGGLVIVEIVSAIFCFSIKIIIMRLN